MQLKTSDVVTLSSLLKLPPSIIYRLNDLIIWARLNPNFSEAHREYRLSMKRRLYIRCMRSYPELFSGKKDEIAPQHGAVLSESYLYNDIMEEDQFARNKPSESD
jgi:hypothetical protein